MSNKPEIPLTGYTKKAMEFLDEKRKATIDEVAIHLGLGLNHTRDVLFRARERGLVRKVPVTFQLTGNGRKAIAQHASVPEDGGGTVPTDIETPEV